MSTLHYYGANVGAAFPRDVVESAAPTGKGIELSVNLDAVGLDKQKVIDALSTVIQHIETDTWPPYAVDDPQSRRPLTFPVWERSTGFAVYVAWLGGTHQGEEMPGSVTLSFYASLGNGAFDTSPSLTKVYRSRKLDKVVFPGPGEARLVIGAINPAFPGPWVPGIYDIK